MRNRMALTGLIFLIVLGSWGSWAWLNWHKGPWKILSQIDPDPKVEFDALLFLDEHKGFAFAHVMEDKADATEGWRGAEAWVYETSDGGHHWPTKKPLGNGYIFAVNKVPNGPLFLIQRFIGKDGEWRVALRESGDEGTTWSRRDAGWDQTGYQILDLKRGFSWGNGPTTTWTEVKDGLVGSVTGQPPLLFYTENGSETWERINVPWGLSLQSTPPAIHSDGSLFYIHEERLVHLTRGPDGQWREEIEELPSSLRGDMLYADTYGDSKTVWIIAHEPPPPDETQEIVQAHLLRWDGPGKIEPVRGLSLPKGFMVDAIFRHDSVMTLVGADYSAAHFAPVTVFRSEDGGRRWRSERPAIRHKARPIFFYGSHKIWAIGTENRLQSRE